MAIYIFSKRYILHNVYQNVYQKASIFIMRRGLAVNVVWFLAYASEGQAVWQPRKFSRKLENDRLPPTRLDHHPSMLPNLLLCQC